jgi:predicted PurR-regulated permease PerM
VLVFIVVLLVVGLLAYYIITSVAGSFKLLIQNAPDYFSQGLATFHEWVRNLQQWFPPEAQQGVEGFVQDVGTTLGNALRSAFIKGLSYVPATFGMVLGFVSLPIFLFYLLKDSERLSSGFYSAFSPRVAKHVKGIVSVIGGVLGRWVRAQLVLALTVAFLCFIGLYIMGIGLAPALAVFAGMMEFIPILGPWIGGIVGVIVTLAVAPEKAIWAALVYIIVQLLENALLVPRIHGSYLQIHPAVIIVLLALGAYIAGIWGIVLIVPLAATVVQIYKYLRQNMVVEGIRPASE